VGFTYGASLARRITRPARTDPRLDDLDAAVTAATTPQTG
jgi:hypothetical protein